MYAFFGGRTGKIEKKTLALTLPSKIKPRCQKFTSEVMKAGKERVNIYSIAKG